MLLLDMSVLQQSVLPGRVRSTAAVLSLDVSVLQQTVLPGRVYYKAFCAVLRHLPSRKVFSLQQLVLHLDVYVYKGLFFTCTCLYTRTVYKMLSLNPLKKVQKLSPQNSYRPKTFAQ